MNAKEYLHPYGFVYITTNLINGKRYVGQKSFSSTKGGKWQEYLGSGVALKHAINKYGKENFKKDIVYIANTPEELYRAEQDIILFLNASTDDNYYNISDGQYSNSWINKTDDEKRLIRELLSQSMKNYINTLSEEEKSCRDEQLRKYNFWNTADDNAKQTAIDKFRSSNFWNVASEEEKQLAKNKLCNNSFWKIATDKQKQAANEKRSKTLSEKFTGSGNPNYGKHRSDDSKNKMRNTCKNKIQNGEWYSASLMIVFVDSDKLTFHTKKDAYDYLCNHGLMNTSKKSEKFIGYAMFRQYTNQNKQFDKFTYELK